MRLIAATLIAAPAYAAPAYAAPAYAAPAYAAPQCGSAAKFRDVLEKTYHETEVAAGMINDKQILVVFASPEGTWTALVVMTDGGACVVAGGKGWSVKPDGEGM